MTKGTNAPHPLAARSLGHQPEEGHAEPPRGDANRGRERDASHPAYGGGAATVDPGAARS